MREQELLKIIRERKTCRAPFDEDCPIDPSVLRQILDAAACAPTAHNIQNFKIVVVDDRSILLELSELESQVSSLFIQENYRYVSLTEDELIRKKTGFLSNQFPPSWLSADAQEGKVSQPAAKLGGQVRRGPVMLFVLYDPTLRAPASEGDFLGAMSLGFMLENIWLIATACGLGFQIISSLGNEPLSGEIKKILDIPPSLKLVFGCRLGYPSAEDKYRLRVCRDVEDFVHFNRYK